jgi:hypothetical protein
MLFDSPEFIAFFVLVYCLYVLLPFRPQNMMLLIASYVFYGWWDNRFLFLVALSTTVDFWVALMLENGQLTPSAEALSRTFPGDFGFGVPWCQLGSALGSPLHHSRLPRPIPAPDDRLGFVGTAGFLAESPN